MLKEDTVIPRGVAFETGFVEEQVVMMATGCGTRRINRRTSQDSDCSDGGGEGGVFGELLLLRRLLFLVEKCRFD